MPSADRVFCTTLSEGVGDVVLDATPFSSKWFMPPASLDGEPVDYAIIHRTQNEVETGTCVYDHPTLTLLRAAGTASRSTAGEGVKQSFSAGTKDVILGYGAAQLNAKLALATASADGLMPSASVRAIVVATALKTSLYTAAVGEAVRTSTAGGGFDVTLPATPSDGSVVEVEDAASGGSWSTTNPLTVVTSDGSTMEGNPGVDGVAHYGARSVTWRYSSATTNWHIVAVAIGGVGLGGIEEVVEDTTPELGGPLDGNGQIIAGNVLRQGTRSDAGTPLALADSGGDFVSAGPFTVPNIAGWHCDIELAANTHDISHNALTLDVSAAGFAGGEIYSIRVRAGNVIRVLGPAGQFTQADFS